MLDTFSLLYFQTKSRFFTRESLVASDMNVLQLIDYLWILSGLESSNYHCKIRKTAKILIFNFTIIEIIIMLFLLLHLDYLPLLVAR